MYENDIKPQEHIVNIGPECFALQDGSLLSWKGQNYVPQKESLRVRLHNWYVQWTRKGDAGGSGVR